jgi:hypothetical protein
MIHPALAHLTRQLSAREAIALITIQELGQLNTTVTPPMLQSALHTWTWKGPEAKRILRSIANKGFISYNCAVKPAQIAVNATGKRLLHDAFQIANLKKS